MINRVLRKPQVEEVTGLTERTLRKMEAEGNFPKRFTLNPSGRAVGWNAADVEAWVEARARGVEEREAS
jgi:predicted DNA-binding transcriptional regulator AlpA